MIERKLERLGKGALTVKEGPYKGFSFYSLLFSHPAYLYDLLESYRNKEMKNKEDEMLIQNLSLLLEKAEQKKPTELCTYCERKKVKYFAIRKERGQLICGPILTYCEDCAPQSSFYQIVEEINFAIFAKYEKLYKGNISLGGGEFVKDMSFLFKWAFSMEYDQQHLGKAQIRDFLNHD